MMDRVLQTSGVKLILSRSEYNNFSLFTVQLAKEDIYCHIMIIIDSIIISKNVLSSMKNTVGNGLYIAICTCLAIIFLFEANMKKDN